MVFIWLNYCSIHNIYAKQHSLQRFTEGSINRNFRLFGTFYTDYNSEHFSVSILNNYNTAKLARSREFEYCAYEIIDTL